MTTDKNLIPKGMKEKILNALFIIFAIITLVTIAANLKL